jgi:hypothetical protein
MEKDGSSGSTGKDAELDALLSATDRGMLEAIRDNLDLDTGFAQILGDIAGVTPAGRQREQQKQDLAATLTVTAMRLTRFLPAGFPAQTA